MPYYNGDLNNQMLPTTTQIKKYLRLANTKVTNNTRRDVRPLMSFLQRLLESDLYLMGLVQTRKRAITSFKWGIRLPEEFKMTSTEEKQLTETKTRFRRSNMLETIEDIEDGILFGMSAVRLTFDNTRYGTMVVKKDSYDLTDLDFDDNSESLVEVTTNDNGSFTKTELDPEVHLITRYNPMRNRKNYVGSFMRTIMLLSYLKYQTRWDWSDLNERHGIPPTYATHPDGLDDKEIDKIIAMVEKLRKDSAAVFPDYVKILYEQALKGDSTDSFFKFINAANLEMAICLHGQNLTTQITENGSKAASETHNEIDDLVLNADVKIIVQKMTQQYLRQDYLNNYGEPRNDFFEFYNIVEEQQDYESNSRIIANVVDTLQGKLPMKKSEVYLKLGLTPPAEGEETI